MIPAALPATARCMRPEPSNDAAATEAPERPSKTERKQAAHDLQALGKALAEMSPERLGVLAIDERVREAVLTWQRTRSHEGRRRQMQYVGKLMRGVDVEPIRAVVQTEQAGRAQDAIALHAAERWRAELLADDDALTRWVAAHPQADLQALRTLVRNARRDAADAPGQRSGKAYRDLFRFLREHGV